MNLPELEKELSKFNCDSDFSQSAKALYATDASNYRHIPIGVIFPKTAEEIINVVALCRRFGLPITSRGGGTGLAGQTCNEAVILDMSRHYNRILELNPEERTAVVQPGIVLDRLREAAEKHDLTFGPDPATHSRCTLGGMLGNNSCGVHSVMAGKTNENTLELDILTYDGLRMTVGPTTASEFAEILKQGGRRAEIYQQLQTLALAHADRIRTKYPDIPRRVSGYNLDELLAENGFQVARALVGSEGTCVIVLEAKLRLVQSPQKRALVIVGFTDLIAAGNAAPELMKTRPIGLEGIDEFLVDNMKRKHLHVEDVQALPKGEAWLLVEVGEDTDSQASAHAELVAAAARSLAGFVDLKVLLKKTEQQKIWEVRESGLGATAFVPGQRDAWPGWEDSAVPPSKVGPYLKELRQLFQKYDYQAALYGHFGQGCIHCRITFDLLTKEGIEKYHRFAVEAAHLVVSFGGSLSGEHGDGQSRAELLPIMFGQELVEAFEGFKEIWDPDGRMNPGKIVKAQGMTQSLRLGTGYNPPDLKTHFSFPDDEGSFARATLRCVGVGQCRKEDAGVMCPSYMVTREEKHSTRGRAHLLFEMLQGDVIQDGWKSKQVKEALDLCFACKGCKGECPVNVDMATYKAEFLSHFYKGKLRPLAAYSMGRIQDFCRVAKWAPQLINFFTQSKLFAPLIKRLGGIHPARTIPKFAPKNFRQTARLSPGAVGGQPVLLWVDTFNNMFHPEVLQSAVHVLERAGFEVRLTKRQLCCGRPLYDFGFLEGARKHLQNILDELHDEIRDGLPVIFLEPGCASVFRDELKSMFPKNQNAMRLTKQSYLLSEFLVHHVPSFKWPQVLRQAVVQGHCHHQSILDFSAEKQALMNMGLDYQVLDAGCCGMAGSFGFEREHYEISQKAGERVLFPALRKQNPETLILADGFSCREQIQQATGKRVYHLAEILDGGANV